MSNSYGTQLEQAVQIILFIGSVGMICYCGSKLFPNPTVEWLVATSGWILYCTSKFNIIKKYVD